MDRLTKRIDGGYVVYTAGRYEDTLPIECEAEDVRNIMKRLAAYEDTGLEPEQTSLLAEKQTALEEHVLSLEARNYRLYTLLKTALKDINKKSLCRMCKNYIEPHNCRKCHAVTLDKFKWRNAEKVKEILKENEEYDD